MEWPGKIGWREGRILYHRRRRFRPGLELSVEAEGAESKRMSRMKGKDVEDEP
jgi:hypothetical protein